jgi:predicted RNA-binding protein associated with RNAse of E/G family
MARGGYVVDTSALMVGQPGGPLWALDRLELAGGRLYYALSIAGDPSISYQETWLIPDEGWAITRFRFQPQPVSPAIDWKLETDWIEAHGDTWLVHDGFLDLAVTEGLRAELEDADELAEAIRAGEIALEDALAVLQSLDRLWRALRQRHYSGLALLRDYAPGLPS